MSLLERRDVRVCAITPHATADQIRNFRKELGLTQEEFAAQFNVPLGTLRDWEQGLRKSRASQIFAALVEGKMPSLRLEVKQGPLKNDMPTPS